MPRIRLSHGDLDGLEIHYASTGQGPVTLLIHGLGGFAESWRQTITALETQSRVISFDLPGFGQSAKPRRAYTLDFFARVVAGLLRKLEVERVRVVGHSLGGAIAAAFVCAHPEQVERLALIAATVPGFPLRPSAIYRLLSTPGIGELACRLVTRRICAEALARCFVVSNPAEVAFLVGHQYAVRATREGRAAYLATLRGVGPDFTDKAAGYRAAFVEWDRPTLLIHGRQDPVVPIRHAEAAARGIPRAVARALDRCGHFPQIEHPEAVHGWLGEFLLAGSAR